MNSEVKIKVAGVDYLARAFSIESNLLQPADAFSVEIPNPSGKLAGKFEPFDAVQVLVDETVQMTGWVDDVNYRPGSVEITGRDRFGQLTDVSATPQTLANLDLRGIAERLSSPFVTEWIFDNEENRRRLQTAKRRYSYLKRKADAYADYVSNNAAALFRETASGAAELDRKRLAKAKANIAAIRSEIFPRTKVSPGETPMQVIERAAAKTGLLVWQASDGRGVIAKPSYDQQPAYRIALYPSSSTSSLQNNVLGFQHTVSGRDLFASYRIQGTAANTETTSGEGSRHEVTESQSVALDRQVIIPRGGGQTRRQAQLELARDVQRRQFDAMTLSYTVSGLSQGGMLWQVDTMVSVDDYVNGMVGSYYLTRRLFKGSLAEGQQTEIELHPAGIYLA